MKIEVVMKEIRKIFDENRRVVIELSDEFIHEAMMDKDFLKCFPTQSSNLVSMTLENNGMALEYVKEKTPESCLVAIKQNEKAVKFVPKKLQYSIPFRWKAREENPNVKFPKLLDFTPEKFKEFMKNDSENKEMYINEFLNRFSINQIAKDFKIFKLYVNYVKDIPLTDKEFEIIFPIVNEVRNSKNIKINFDLCEFIDKICEDMNSENMSEFFKEIIDADSSIYESNYLKFHYGSADINQTYTYYIYEGAMDNSLERIDSNYLDFDILLELISKKIFSKKCLKDFNNLETISDSLLDNFFVDCLHYLRGDKTKEILDRFKPYIMSFIEEDEYYLKRKESSDFDRVKMEWNNNSDWLANFELELVKKDTKFFLDIIFPSKSTIKYILENNPKMMMFLERIDEEKIELFFKSLGFTEEINILKIFDEGSSDYKVFLLNKGFTPADIDKCFHRVRSSKDNYEVSNFNFDPVKKEYV